MFNQTASVQIDDNIKTDLILKEGTDIIPKIVKPDIQPCYEVNRRVANVVRSGSFTASGTNTIFTTPTNRDFFMTGITLSICKDATCDIASGRIAITANVGGTSRDLIAISVLTTTAERDTISLEFAVPVKIDRSAAIATGGNTTFAAGNLVRSVTIYGYTNSPLQPTLRVTEQ